MSESRANFQKVLFLSPDAFTCISVIRCCRDSEQQKKRIIRVFSFLLFQKSDSAALDLLSDTFFEKCEKNVHENKINRHSHRIGYHCCGDAHVCYSKRIIVLYLCARARIRYSVYSLHAISRYILRRTTLKHLPTI